MIIDSTTLNECLGDCLKKYVCFILTISLVCHFWQYSYPSLVIGSLVRGNFGKSCNPAGLVCGQATVQVCDRVNSRRAYEVGISRFKIQLYSVLLRVQNNMHDVIHDVDYLCNPE